MLAPSEYNVKGSSLRSKLDWALDTQGGAAAEELVRILSEAGVETLLDSSWYPFELFERLNREIVRRFLGGTVSRLQEVGEFSAARALTTTYSAYGQKRSFVEFLGRMASLHRRFYDQGSMKVELDSDQHSCVVHLRGAPSYPETDLWIAQGFYIGAARHFGLGDVSCRHRLEGGGAGFDLRWG